MNKDENSKNAGKDDGEGSPQAELDPQKLQEELSEFKDKYIRIVAEFDNARKRYDRERVEFVKYANEGLIGEFLGILDDLERTVQAAKTNQQDQSALLKGIEMVMGRIHELLKRNDVKSMKTVGEKFDPHCHEILMLADSDAHKEGTIIEEFQKGYLLGDKVVRTAKVKVAKPKSSAAQSTQQAEQTSAEEAP